MANPGQAATDTGDTRPFDGGCTCRQVRYRLTTRPLIVHCCHCRWCQRESGAAFALNALYEADRVTTLGADPEIIATPSHSGLGQRIARCPSCRVAVWSHYAGSGAAIKFVRVGTMDEPDALPPDVHIYTASKQPWVVIPQGTPAFAEYYDREALWPAQSLSRREALLPLIDAQKNLADAPLSGGAPIPFRVLRLDHVVFRVRDTERSAAFYARALGCSIVKRRDDLGLIHLSAGASLIDLVSVDGPLGRKGGPPAGAQGHNVDHVCLRIEPFDEQVLVAHLSALDARPIRPASVNFGAEGNGPSLYFRDPDGNIIELKGPSAGR